VVLQLDIAADKLKFIDAGCSMHITKILIRNFKCFSGTFVLELTNGLNVLVGDNEAGKSTILEAINLVLS
jgi:putative ATP-dependent endonuclease of the OLD family